MVLGTASKVAASEAYDKAIDGIVDYTMHKIFWLDEHIQSNTGLLQVFAIVRKP